MDGARLLAANSDPGNWIQSAINACCDVVNRGVAAWVGRVYVGTLDGRLIALDAASGNPVWEVKTVPEGGRYTITGAPRVVKGMVLIGNGGGEMGIRGYVTAYDAEDGKQLYVLDRATGELISADAFATTTWAKGVDLKSGRPTVAQGDARCRQWNTPCQRRIHGP